MNLDEWRKLRTQGEAATLPSGLEVQLRKVSVVDLAQSGQIPATLRPVVNELITKPPASPSLDDLGEFGAVVDVVAAACLVGPEGLEVTELPWADRLAIYMWANEAAGKLEPFRAQNGKSVDAPFAVGELRAKAK